MRSVSYYMKHGTSPINILCLLLALLMLVGFYYAQHWNIPRDVSTRDAISTNQRLLVDTPGCKIPQLSPFHDSIRHLVFRTGTRSCNATPALLYVDGSMLRVNHTALQEDYKGDLHKCAYETITRPDENSDDLFQYEPRVWFDSDVELKSEFVRVTCYSASGDIVYANFHPLILHKEDVEARCDARMQRNSQMIPKDLFNVLLVGVDSVSRLNFMRQMPKTRGFLLKTLHAVDLRGYNKVADNTFVNLSPMFAGKFVEELPWDETKNDEPFDQKEFIWKNFSRLGYRTLFAEDAPEIAIFNYDKAGFRKPPMDYYLRPFSLAMEDHGSLWSPDHHCVGPKLETQIVLDWVKDFTLMYKVKKKPTFAFAFITRLTHDNINKVGAADEPYYTFFRSLQERGVLDDTILFFFSDHGMRFGALRETYIGKMEERLPFMFVYVPETFKQYYPKLHNTLQENAGRLTTPFDIYETLKNILFVRNEIKTPSLDQRGISLFQRISPKRTCSHAAILPHWCTCHQTIGVATSEPDIVGAGRAVVDSINNMLKTHGKLCATLAVDTIRDAKKIVANEDVLRFRESIHDVIGRRVTYGEKVNAVVDYTLTVKTQPGGGLFEATIRHFTSSKTYELLGEVSRINRYGGQSYCIEMFSHKKYCYCDTSLE